MKILFITNNYTPYSGGVVSSIHATVHALQKKGHEVRIITFQFTHEHNDPPYVYRIPTLVKFIYKKNRMVLGWWSRTYIKQVVVDFEPAIVHVHHPFLLGPVAVALAHLYNVPAVFTYHTMYEKYTHYVPLPRILVEKILFWRVKTFMQSVDGIIVPSRVIYERIASLGMRKPIWVVPSGLQERFAQFSFEQKAYKLSEVFNLIVVSRFSKEKNVQAALDVLALLPEYVHLTLVGYGNQEVMLRDYAKKLKLSAGRVTFIIDPPKDILPRLYQQAHLFIFTSQTDTQGLVLAESMAASTPVLAFPGPGQEDIMVNGVNGFIVSSVSEMAQYVHSIMNNPELYVQLQQGAFKTSQRYHADVLCDTLLAAYHQLIAIRSRPT